MKKFMESLLEWKTYAALMFSGTIILSIVFSIYSGEESIPVSVIIYLLILSVIGTFLQFLAFTDRIIKKMRYTSRMVLFAIPFFVVLASIAYFFEWFPLEARYWLTFTIIYLVVFIVMTTGFEIYYRALGKKYDGLLGQYRKQKEIEKKD